MQQKKQALKNLDLEDINLEHDRRNQNGEDLGTDLNIKYEKQDDDLGIKDDSDIKIEKPEGFVDISLSQR